MRTRHDGSQLLACSNDVCQATLRVTRLLTSKPTFALTKTFNCIFGHRGSGGDFSTPEYLVTSCAIGKITGSAACNFYYVAHAIALTWSPVNPKPLALNWPPTLNSGS